MKINLTNIIFVVLITVFFLSCEKDETQTSFKNDFIKQSVEPAIVGQKLEFKYALGTLVGKLKSASVEASIEGFAGTGFSRHSIYTDRGTGIDKNVLTVKDSITNGSVSTVQLVDTNAVTLRYYYVIPEAARGKKIYFEFSGINTSGNKVSIRTPEYNISKMDMKRSILLKDGGACYFSIADMTAYTKEQVDAQNLSGKIDFVYLYKTTMGNSGGTFGHSIVSLANGNYLTSLSIPNSWTKLATKMEKRIDNMKDGQLKGAPPTVFIDDIDLESPQFNNASDYALTLSADQGALVQTQDKNFTSYVYVNKVDNGKREMTISLKRLKIK
mgnify:CR=1 FL=1